jgi:hypothetical protein
MSSGEQVIILSGEDKDFGKWLVSGNTLPEHTWGCWDLEAPTLPDEPPEEGLQSIYWHAAVCLAALSWLRAQGPGASEESLHPVFKDLIHSLNAGSVAFTRHAQTIHLRSEPVELNGETFQCHTHAIINLARRCIRMARCFVGEPGTPEHIASRWAEVYAHLLPELSSGDFKPSRMAEAMLRELRTCAGDCINVVPQPSKPPASCPVELRDEGRRVIVLGQEQNLHCTPKEFSALQVLVRLHKEGKRLGCGRYNHGESAPDLCRSLRDLHKKWQELPEPYRSVLDAPTHHAGREGWGFITPLSPHAN